MVALLGCMVCRWCTENGCHTVAETDRSAGDDEHTEKTHSLVVACEIATRNEAERTTNRWRSWLVIDDDQMRGGCDSYRRMLRAVAACRRCGVRALMRSAPQHIEGVKGRIQMLCEAAAAAVRVCVCLRCCRKRGQIVRHDRSLMYIVCICFIGVCVCVCLFYIVYHSSCAVRIRIGSNVSMSILKCSI